jgi:CoA:oxalate CoA-transferase
MEPLAGIRVLDFSRYQQGPFATVILADLGADVIKVEPPGVGDFGRRLWKEPDGFSAFWEALDRGKRSVVIDLKRPEAREIVLRMVEQVDVVVENFRPGTMEEWGLGYETLRERNPRLVYGQATGWGTKGPLARLPSFDQIAQAHSGYSQHAGGGPGQRPEVPFPGLADQVSGMNLALAVMTGLFVRERTGIGQKVEVSLLGTMLAVQAPEILHYLHFGVERPREFRASPIAGHYECRDGRWVMIVCTDQKFWPRLCRALHLEELIDDERFARGLGRWLNREELQRILEAQFKTQDSAYWLARLEAEDVPSALVRSYAEVAEDEQSWANGYLAETEHPRFGRQRVVGPHIQLSATPARLSRPAPELGAHTLEVLREFGFAEAELRRLLDAGVIWDPQGQVPASP